MFGKLRFYRKCLAWAGLAALAVAGAVFAYSPHYTHPDLTEEMFEFYNSAGNQKVESEFLSALRQGSIEEDIDPRWINHFYDPQFGEGWTGEHLGPHGKEVVQGVSNSLVAMNFTPIAASDWAEDQEAQNKFINYGWNHTWQKAIYDYANGDKKAAFESLGYVLHLIEDMSVPDHTRNDSHPHVAGDPGSPYEEWSKTYTNGNKLDTAERLAREKAAVPLFLNLKEAFDYVAKYSNENFFSEETIVGVRYSKPTPQNPVSDGINSYIYYLEDNFGNYPTVRATRLEDNSIKYTINDERILSGYFSRLSRRAVLAGAGVIELFFREAEKAKNNPSLLEKPPAPPTAMGTVGTLILTRVVSPLGSISPIARGVYSAFSALRSALFASVSDLEAKPTSSDLPRQGGASEQPAPAAPLGSARPAEEVKNENVAGEQGDENDNSLPPYEGGREGLGVLRDGEPPGSLQNFPSPYEGEGRGGEVNGVKGESVPSFLQLQPVGGGSAGFGGGGEVSSLNSALPPISKVPPPISDTTPPDISLSISECPGLAAVAGECLVASSTIHIEWSSVADDLDYFIFNSASTTATSTVYTFSEEGTSNFEIKAVDKAGNESAATKTVVFSTRPVVINEVAWAGTVANSADEWIELYNRSSRAVNLSNWALAASDGVPYINLSGTIYAGGYYLIERTDDNAVSDIAADLKAPFSGTGTGSGLGNIGETLTLSYGSTTVDQNILCSGAWCGGTAAATYKSMERIDPDVAGTDAANWGTSNGIVKNGLDSAGSPLTATPKGRNSLHYLISQVSTLTADRTLKASFGEYIIPQNETLIVPAGKTLTIEPGVTVKIGGSSSLEVNGTMVANGTSANNIVFTNLSPPNYWRNVRITSTSQNSSVSYARFRYGGQHFSNTPLEWRAELSVINNSITVSNSTFENSYSDGLRLTVSNSTVTGNTFSVGTTSATNIGLEASAGSPTISQNTFSENYLGLRLNTDTAASAQNNTFTNNLNYAVYSVNATSTFSGNSGSGNGKNGIALVGTIAAVGGTTTLSANSLPYLIGSYPYENPKIAAGSALVVGAGTTLKGEANNSRFEVEGTMKLEGANKDSILFTSLVDVTPDATVGAGWYGITLSSTGYVYGGGFTLRYGGGAPSCSGCAGFSVIGGRVNLFDGRIQNNYKVGMQIYNSATSSLSNFEFSDHQTPSGNSTALVSSNSTLILDNLVFSNNQTNTSPPGLY